jgi:hypothetical protein
VFIRRLKTDREKITGCSTVHTREIRHLYLGADTFVKGYVGKGSTFQCALNNFLRTNHLNPTCMSLMLFRCCLVVTFLVICIVNFIIDYSTKILWAKPNAHHS